MTPEKPRHDGEPRPDSDGWYWGRLKSLPETPLEAIRVKPKRHMLQHVYRAGHGKPYLVGECDFYGEVLPATDALGTQEGEWFITEFIGGGTSNIIANAPDPMKRRCLAYAIDENAAALIVAAHNAALASHARTIEALRTALSFYAESDNWLDHYDGGASRCFDTEADRYERPAPMREDEGAIARRALKEHPNG